jgi:ectoine hydroxylase-related dioxygenase (phytanoyl-CoA dioxygenase family)
MTPYEGTLSSVRSTNSGFAIVRQVFNRTELAGVIGLFVHELSTRSRAGARHLLRIPLVRDLANDSRLLTLAAETLGASSVAFRATLFDKSPDANWLVAWHQDTALPLRRRVDAEGWGPWSVKAGVLCAHAPAAALEQVVALRLHLDDSVSANGPLRVLPGTHNRGVLSDDEIAQLPAEIRPVECLAPAGGVVAMRPLLVHASSKSRDARPRRVLHIEYATSLTFRPDLELAVS